MINDINIKRLFIIDSATLALFGAIIIVIAYQGPIFLNILLQAILISLTSWQLYTFLRKRLFCIAIIKTLLLLILFLIDLLH